MENIVIQRELEDELRKLRIELKLHERRVKSVESKVNKDVENQGPKRRRDEVSTIDQNKRLRSAVSVVTKGDVDSKSKGNEDDDVPIENVRKSNDLDEENSNKKAIKLENKEKAEGESPAAAIYKGKAAQRRSSGDKNRDRRLFSSLQGTLNSFKRSINQENELKTIQKKERSRNAN